jgi:hypothetical protein
MIEQQTKPAREIPNGKTRGMMVLQLHPSDSRARFRPSSSVV